MNPAPERSLPTGSTPTTPRPTTSQESRDVQRRYDRLPRDPFAR